MHSPKGISNPPRDLKWLAHALPPGKPHTGSSDLTLCARRQAEPLAPESLLEPAAPWVLVEVELEPVRQTYTRHPVACRRPLHEAFFVFSFWTSDSPEMFKGKTWMLVFDLYSCISCLFV